MINSYDGGISYVSCSVIIIIIIILWFIVRLRWSALSDQLSFFTSYPIVMKISLSLQSEADEGENAELVR